jgi:hypothetical protein
MFAMKILLGMFLAITVCTADERGSAQDLDDSWLEDFSEQQAVLQVSEGELVFLTERSESETLHSINHITITESSLDTGWVQVDQCYRGLDAVPRTEIVYRYREMRNLHILDSTNIEQATAGTQSVELTNVKQNASLCIRTDARILQQTDAGHFSLRNGPFHRRFLDGYFPLHVRFTVHYPSALLAFESSMPQKQPGFMVQTQPGEVAIDTWFAGVLTIEIRFLETD